MRGRGTALLVLAFVAAAAWLYFDVTASQPDATWRTIFEEPAPPLPAADLKRVLAFDPATVTALTVQRGERTTRTERTAEGWRGAPKAADVDDFVRGLSELAVIVPIEATAGVATYGLDPPSGSIEIERRDGPPIVLLIGDRNPPATGVYAQVGRGGPVVLTGALLLWDVDKFQRALQASAQ